MTSLELKVKQKPIKNGLTVNLLQSKRRAIKNNNNFRLLDFLERKRVSKRNDERLKCGRLILKSNLLRVGGVTLIPTQQQINFSGINTTVVVKVGGDEDVGFAVTVHVASRGYRKTSLVIGVFTSENKISGRKRNISG